MATDRDMQKSKLYEAEKFVRRTLDTLANSPSRTLDFYGSTLVIPDERKFGDLEGVQRYVDALQSLNWVRAAWSRAEVPVTVRARKGSRFAHYEPWGHVLAVPPHQGGLSWAMRELVILHEMTHHLTRSVQAHGPDFAGTFLALVTEAMGPEVGLLLDDSFTQHGIEIDRKVLREMA